MDNLSSKPPIHGGFDDDFETASIDVPEFAPDVAAEAAGELRTSKRHTLLIRAAKLVSPHGEFVCVIRDVSENGLSVRLFHRAPKGDPVELHMPCGSVYDLRLVWERDEEAGYEFTKPVDVAQLINEAGLYPRRGMRLGVCFPVKARTLSGTFEGVVENLSQQGAAFACDGLFAIEQGLTLESTETGCEFADIRAKIRWRRDNGYGVVFENTLSLKDFARFAARLQCPALLD